MPVLPIAVSEAELVADICRESFFEFVQEFWSEVIPEEPVWNWHIEYLCQEMQKLAERLFEEKPCLYDLIINVPPGSTKSTIVSIMFPVWVWIRMPTSRCICGSYAYPLSMDLSRRSRDIVRSEKYRATFGMELRQDQSAKGYFANIEGGMRYAVGVGGSVTGMHGHFLIVDDPINPLEAVSVAELKVANDWMDSTLSTRKIDKEITPTILIMQRLHQDDPTGNKLAKQKSKDAKPVRHICLPAELTPDVAPVSLRQYYTKGLLDPVRLSRKALAEARVEMGEYGYAGQFLQKPVPLGGGMFKFEKINIETTKAKVLKWVRFWDKAGTDKGGAFTVGVKMGVDTSGRFIIGNVVRGQWASGERERVIKRTARMDGHHVIVGLEQEPGSGGKESAENTARNLAGFTVIIMRPTGSKETRADPFSTQVNVGNVYLIPGDWNADYLEELQYFPYGRYKDQVDGSSGAFGILSDFQSKRSGTW